MRGLVFLFTLVVLLIAGTTAQAQWRGFSTANVNLRTGPGLGYGVVDVVPEGERVFIDHCRHGWCAIEHRGEEGWMSRDYLTRKRVRRSSHLKENDRLEYDGQDYHDPHYDNGSYREVIVVDPPRYRDGRRRGERRWNRRVREGRRIRDGKRVRGGRRIREETITARPAIRRPAQPSRRSGLRTPRGAEIIQPPRHRSPETEFSGK